MSEMVERVAKAIFDILNKENTSGEYIGDYRFHGKETTLDGSFDLNIAAKAAIEAMREPTDEMVIQGMLGIVVAPDNSKTIYQAMIDAALKE